MEENCKFQKLRENLKIKNKLNELGIYGIIGPTGPRGMQGKQGVAGPTGPQGLGGNIRSKGLLDLKVIQVVLESQSQSTDKLLATLI